MARYFFHTANGTPVRDTDGLEMATLHTAELEAVRFLGELLSEEPGALAAPRGLTILVTDADGAVAFTVRASVVRNGRL